MTTVTELSPWRFRALGFKTVIKTRTRQRGLDMHCHAFVQSIIKTVQVENDSGLSEQLEIVTMEIKEFTHVMIHYG